MKGVSIEYLREAFDLEKSTGALTWKIRPLHHFPCERIRNTINSKCAGKIAGAKTQHGYLAVGGGKRRLYAHQVVFALTRGREPFDGFVIDHINGNKLDNRPENLRELTIGENNQNQAGLKATNKSGFAGVYFSKVSKKWVANVHDPVTKKVKYLGSSYDITEAVALRRAYVEKMYAGHVEHAELRK